MDYKENLGFAWVYPDLTAKHASLLTNNRRPIAKLTHKKDLKSPAYNLVAWDKITRPKNCFGHS